VRLAPKSRRRVDIVQSHVREFIHSSYERLALPSVLRGWEANSVLASSVERIALAESACPASSLPMDRVSLQIHTYQPSESDIIEEYSNGPASESGDQVLAASVCELPCRSWEGLWDSLFYPDNVKLKLLDYIHATFVLSDADIDCKYSTLHFGRGIFFTTIAISQSGFLEQSRTAARTTWHGKDISLSCTGSKVVNTAFTSVCRCPLLRGHT